MTNTVWRIIDGIIAVLGLCPVLLVIYMLICGDEGLIRCMILIFASMSMILSIISIKSMDRRRQNASKRAVEMWNNRNVDIPEKPIDKEISEEVDG